MNSTSSTPTSKDKVFCAYCHFEHTNTPEVIQEHMLSCEKRPEYGLLLKMELIKNTGDELLQVLHEFAIAIGNFEGGMTGVWEIYRVEAEKWELSKNIDAKELAKTVKLEDLKGE